MMKKFSVLMVFIGLLISQVSFAQTSKPVAQIVSNTITQFMQQNQIPGVAVALYYQGQDYFYNFGVMNKATRKPVTQNTIFGIASVTKVFTSSLLAICIEQGRCKLDDSVVKYIPALSQTHNLPIDQITLQNLATHTSSLPRDPGKLGANNIATKQGYDKLMQALLRWKPDYPIGTHFRYSNLGYGLLGQAMGNAFNTNYMTALNNEILTPLEMSHTFINIPTRFAYEFAQGYNKQDKIVLPNQNNNWPGGGPLRSTAADLLIFLKANMGLVPQIPPQLSGALQFTHKGIFTVNPNMVQGLGWQRNIKDNLTILNKNGRIPGFSSYVAFLPQQKIAIVILDNRNGPEPKKPAVAILTVLAS